MRILNSIKKPIFFAKYKGKEEITEVVDGKTLRTGDYTLSYGEVGTAFVFLSSPKMGNASVRGEAVLDGDGLHTQYTHHIVTEVDLGLNVDDIVWTGVIDTPSESVEPWTDGFTFNGGAIEPWSNGEPLNGGLTSPWDVGEQKFYRIMAVQPSSHHVTYEVKEL